MFEKMTHFPKYYCNENGWLAKKDAQTGRLIVKPTKMNFPYGKYPYYVIQQDRKKYILFVHEIHKNSPMVEYRK